MTHSQIVRFNQILGDRLGYIPPGFPNSGQPLFQFKRSTELVFPCKSGAESQEQESGLILIQPVTRMERQLPGEDRWVISRWMEPGVAPPNPQASSFEDMGRPRRLSPKQWEEEFGTQWPNGGWWLAIVPLTLGKEVDEEWTQWLGNHLKAQGERTLFETMRLLSERDERIKSEHRTSLQSSLRECWVDHIPGVRGGNYSAFSAPSGVERR